MSIQIPESLRSKARKIYLLLSLARKPKTEYLNRKYPIPKSFYGYVQLMSTDYVIKDIPIEYPKQRIDLVEDGNLLLQVMLPCINQELLQSFANLASGLGLQVYSIENETKNWKRLISAIDEVKFCAWMQSAFNYQLWALKVDNCTEIQNEPTPTPEPPPIPEPPPVPHNQPLIIDEKDDDYDSNDDYLPYEEDEQPPPPPVEEGRWTISWRIIDINVTDSWTQDGLSDDVWTVEIEDTFVNVYRNGSVVHQVGGVFPNWTLADITQTFTAQ